MRKKDFITAAFNSLCYQTNEILDAMNAEGLKIKDMSIDGGMAKNMTFAQLLANITNIKISIPTNTEATAIGAAKVAAVGCGLVKSLEAFTNIGSSKEILPTGSTSHAINYKMWKEYLNTMLALSSSLTNIINNKD